MRSTNGDSLAGVQSGGPDQAKFLEALPHGELGLGVVFAVEPTSLVSNVGGACDGLFDSAGGLSLALQEFYLWPFGAGCSFTRTEPVQIPAWPSSRTSAVCDVGVLDPRVIALGVPGRLERLAAGVRPANGDSLAGVQSGGPDQANFPEVFPQGELGGVFAVEPTSLLSVVGGACDGLFESAGGSSLALQEFYLWPFGAGCFVRPGQANFLEAFPHGELVVVFAVEPASLVSVGGGNCDGPVESDEGSSLALQEVSLWPFGAGCSAIRPLSGVRHVDVAHTCGAGREAQTCLDRNVDIGGTCGAGREAHTCLDRNVDTSHTCGAGRGAQTCLDRNVHVGNICGAGREAQTCLDRNVDIGDTCGSGRGCQTCLDRNVYVGDTSREGESPRTPQVSLLIGTRCLSLGSRFNQCLEVFCLSSGPHGHNKRFRRGGGQSWEVEAGRVAQAPQALKRLKRSTRTLKRLSGLRWEVEPPRVPEAA